MEYHAPALPHVHKQAVGKGMSGSAHQGARGIRDNV